MVKNSVFFKRIIVIASIAFIVLCLLFLYIYKIQLLDFFDYLKSIIPNKEQVENFISGLGPAAPIAFILLQILQVIFAPVPGEFSGVVGGYLFGTWWGFLLSSFGLAIGSWINFVIGRFLGNRFVRKKIPEKHLIRLDSILKRQGLFIVFILFVFPGFPKDYLCLFLGISKMPIKAFLFISSVGRMPGTFMLSLQGAALLEQMYGLAALIFGVCLIFIAIASLFKEKIYQFIDNQYSQKI